MSEVLVKDRVIEGSFVIDEPTEPNLARAKNSVRVVEFGKLPTQIEVETGKRISDLVSQGVVRPGQDYFVNGNQVGEDYVLQEGDGLVAAPRITGGQI
jgi:hypothetical protein